MSFFKTNDTHYGKVMDSMSKQYEALICRAETQRRDCGGKPSKQEAFYYRDAAKICEEIRDMNLSQRAEYSKWNSRAQGCMDNVREIVNYLAPKTAETSAPAEASVPLPQNAVNSFTPPRSVKSQDTDVLNEKSSVSQTEKSGVSKKGTPVTTASGFTTYNAVKDVPAEVIERWYKTQPTHDFSDVTGMADAKKRLSGVIENLGYQKTKEIIDYEEQKCIFFMVFPEQEKLMLSKLSSASL